MPSPKQASSNRSRSRSSQGSSPKGSQQGSQQGSQGEEDGEEQAYAPRRRHPRKPAGPRLNTWDVPEFMPGAMPGATPVQRALFEERSVRVFKKSVEQEAADADESRKRAEAELAEKLENDLSTLHQLFPSMDLELIQESYLSFDSHLEATIHQLLSLSAGTTPKRQGPPKSDDETEFPVLTALKAEIELTIEEVKVPQNPKICK